MSTGKRSVPRLHTLQFCNDMPARLSMLSRASPSRPKLLGLGCNSTERAERPGCELYGRVFCMTVRYHYVGPRKAAEQPRIVPQLPPSGRMCVWEGEAVEYGRNSTIRARSRAGSGQTNWADRSHTELALYSAQRARCARHPEWAFPRVGPTGSRTRLRGVRPSYGRVLGTHGRPAMGTCWWPPKGPRIVFFSLMVGDLRPWHRMTRARPEDFDST